MAIDRAINPSDRERRLVDLLEQHEEIRFALLFGSRGQSDGRPRPDSDWDIAFYLGDGSSEKSRFDLRRQLAAELEEIGDVDIVALDDAPPLLAHRALMGRALLMRDKVAYVRFFVRAQGRADDARHLAKPHRKARLARLKAGTFGRP